METPDSRLEAENHIPLSHFLIRKWNEWKQAGQDQGDQARFQAVTFLLGSGMNGNICWSEPPHPVDSLSHFLIRKWNEWKRDGASIDQF